MPPRPGLSVVIPHRNHGRFIAVGVKSLLDQSVPPDEVVIVDDASTDGSVEVLKELAKDPRVKLVLRGVNKGVFETLCEALALATRPYVYCMAADDLTGPGFLEKSLDLLARHPEAGFSCAMAGLVAEDGRYLGPYHTPRVRDVASYLPPAEFADAFLRHGSWVVSYSVIYRRDVMLEAMKGVPPLGPTLDGFLIHSLGGRFGACFTPEELVLWRPLQTGYANTYGRDVAASGVMIERLHDCLAALPPPALPPAYLERLRRSGYEEILNNLSHQPAFDAAGAALAASRLRGGDLRLRLYKAAVAAGAGRRAAKLYLFAGLPLAAQLRVGLRKLGLAGG